ncbi:MAG: response regulator [Chitinispirillaceae bacterium]|nr:response regulator [Chitinispirillaceae bacterium]
MKKRILVIEDNEQNIYLVTYLLENAGFEVTQARDGRTGINYATTQFFDLIVLDIQLPEMDGYEVAKNLRATPALDTIPIVAVTSHAMAGDREHVLEAGCTEYIEKPIDPFTFVRSITQRIGTGGNES